MKIKLMLPVAAALSIIIIIACNKTSSNKDQKASITGRVTKTLNNTASTARSSSRFNKAVGQLFPADTINTWIANYKHTTKNLSYAYYINSDALETIVNTTGCTGILFYHGLKDGQWIILPYGVDSSEHLIQSETIFLGDRNITMLQAEQYKNNYQQSSRGVQGHFFGSDIIRYLIEQEGSKTIRFQRGLNEHGEQLLITNGNVLNPDDGGDRSVPPCNPPCSL